MARLPSSKAAKDWGPESPDPSWCVAVRVQPPSRWHVYRDTQPAWCSKGFAVCGAEPTLTDNLLCCRPARHKQETREDRMKHRLGCTTPCHPTILGHTSTRCASRQKTWEGMLGRGNQAAATGMLCGCSDTHSPDVLPSARQGTGVQAGGNQVAATGAPSTGSTASRSHRSCSWAGAAPPSSPLLPAACSALLPAPAVPGCSPDCAAGCAGLSAVRARQIWSCADFLWP